MIILVIHVIAYRILSNPSRKLFLLRTYSNFELYLVSFGLYSYSTYGKKYGTGAHMTVVNAGFKGLKPHQFVHQFV